MSVHERIDIDPERTGKAQSFQTATPPSFGTFRWLDFSSFPPARHKVSYFWEDEVLYRQPSTDGELEPRIPLARNVSSSADVSFSVTESEHPSNRFSTERLLTAKMTSTIDAGFLGTIAETTTLTVELRPEQSDVLDYLYFYLHNTPPVADTLSQLDLPLDQVKPTNSTLYKLRHE